MVLEGTDSRRVAKPSLGTLGTGFAGWFGSWYMAGLKKDRSVKPTWRTWDRFSLTPDGARHGLAALEQAGLVRVERHPGRCPVVTLLAA